MDVEGGIVAAKIFSMIILSVTSMIAGMLPIKLGTMLYRNSNIKRIILFEKGMSFFLHFGAGVLLCTIFLHLMPEMREEMERIDKETNLLTKFHFSYSDLIVCFGFFFIYSIEQIVHSHLISDKIPKTRQAQSENNMELYANQSCNSISASSCKLGNPADSSMHYKVVECNIQPDGCAEHKHIKGDLCEHKNYHSCENHYCIKMDQESRTAIIGTDLDLQRYHNHEHIPDFSNSISSGLLMVIALSLHEIFEGMSVGLEKKTTMVWYLLAAISCHKTLLSAFIGLQLLATKTKLITAYIFITLYAFTSSVGILFGLLVSLCSEKNVYLEVTSVSLQGIATGTLLYVVFFEIYFKNESAHRLIGSLKAVSSICGFIFMAFLQLQLSD